MQQLVRKIEPGATIAQHTLQTINGETVYLPDAKQLIHLQLRRFAGCPVCNLHLQSIVRRHAEIAAAGIREVVVFHSQAEELRPHALIFHSRLLPILANSCTSNSAWSPQSVLCSIHEPGDQSSTASLTASWRSSVSREWRPPSIHKVVGSVCRPISSSRLVVACSPVNTALTPTISGRPTSCSDWR